MSTMKAIRVSKFGGPEELKLESVPIPEPGPTQVLIKVRAVGINPVDTYTRQSGRPTNPKLPFTPGYDCAGEVQKVGAKVKGFKPGDRVYTTNTVTGSYAEYTVAEDYNVALLPSSASFEEGAALGIPYYTAYRALVFQGQAKPGETVLIHGASGGVGIPCCQMAQAMGLRVLGTAGTKAGLELIRKHGASMGFNHRDPNYVEEVMKATDGKGPDLIIEMLGDVNIKKDMEMVKKHTGRVLIVGCRGTAEINPNFFVMREITVKGVYVLITTKEEFQETHNYIRAGFHSGWVRPVIGAKYPLAKAKQSHIDQIDNSGKVGKLILTV